jgi:hypothetical protein
LHKDKTEVILDSDSDAYDQNLDGTDEEKVDLTDRPISPCQASEGCSSSVNQQARLTQVSRTITLTRCNMGNKEMTPSLLAYQVMSTWEQLKNVSILKLFL